MASSGFMTLHSDQSFSPVPHTGKIGGNSGDTVGSEECHSPLAEETPGLSTDAAPPQGLQPQPLRNMAFPRIYIWDHQQT